MKRLIFTLLLITVVACGPLSPVLARGPYRGKVIDAETKEPIVGAVVFVYWNRHAPGIGHGPIESFLDADEALTDSNGEFVVGKNPPVSMVPGTWVSDPYITIFYPGYGYFPRYHTSPPRPPDRWKGLLRMMEQESVVIELPRMRTREERIQAYDLVNPVEVPDEKKPNLIRLLNQERKNLGFKTFYPEPKQKER